MGYMAHCVPGKSFGTSLEILTMKRSFLILSVALLFLSSCSKDDAPETKGPASAETGFFFAENNASENIKADEATANKQYKTINDGSKLSGSFKASAGGCAGC